jgi:hypothetical protein
MLFLTYDLGGVRTECVLVRVYCFFFYFWEVFSELGMVMGWMAHGEFSSRWIQNVGTCVEPHAVHQAVICGRSQGWLMESWRTGSLAYGFVSSETGALQLWLCFARSLFIFIDVLTVVAERLAGEHAVEAGGVLSFCILTGGVLDGELYLVVRGGGSTDRPRGQ